MKSTKSTQNQIKSREIATKLRLITQITITVSPAEKKTYIQTLFLRAKTTRIFVLLCPRCACISDGPPAADTPRIQATLAAPTSISRC